MGPLVDILARGLYDMAVGGADSLDLMKHAEAALEGGLGPADLKKALQGYYDMGDRRGTSFEAFMMDLEVLLVRPSVERPPLDPNAAPAEPHPTPKAGTR